MKRAWQWLILMISVTTLLISVVAGASQQKILPFMEKALPVTRNVLATPQPSHLFLITVDRLTLKDILDHPTLFQGLIEAGPMGLVSTGVEGGNIPDNTFVSIGAGAPSNAAGTAAHGVNARTVLTGIPALNVFFQRTGVEVTEDHVVQLDIEKIKKQNANNKFSAIPGQLGSLLQEHGYAVEVYGNADNLGDQKRSAVAMAMNTQGVTSGDVSHTTLVEDPDFPGGLRTDYQRMLDVVRAQTGKKGLTVLELGDLERLERMGSYLGENVLQSRRLESMTSMVSFITAVLENIDLRQDMVMVVAPTPRGSNLPDANYLTPVMAMGPGLTPGILSSPTTKRPGIIRNTDLAPTILNYFQVAPTAHIYGRSMQIIQEDNVLSSLSSLYDGIALNYQVRPPLLRYYVLAQLVLVFLSLAAIFMPGRKSLMLVLKPLLLAVMAFPVALLLLTLFPHQSVSLLVVQLLAITTTIIVAVHLTIKDPDRFLNYFILISLFTSLCIALDIFLGSPMQKNSILGYDPIVGARFYGIGNEYMGVLIGATIIGVTALINGLGQRRRLFILGAGVYFLVVLYLIAAPQKGTNVGGSIAALFSFLVTMLLLLEVRFDPKTMLKVTAAVGTFLLALIFYDLQRPVENQSHIGRTAHIILQGGPAEIVNIIIRKFSMNLKLIRYTIWSRVFIASLVSLAILFYRPVGVMQSIKTRYPDIYKGLIGVFVASFVALLFNDSGVVAAATAMIFGVPPLLYLVISTIHARHAP